MPPPVKEYPIPEPPSPSRASHAALPAKAQLSRQVANEGGGVPNEDGGSRPPSSQPWAPP